ncbi:MAG: magnesium transporter [Rhodospirillaceae bacterium]|nr:MAG: magnesium transporter [Rhodospirillaceae bacterium]
MDEQISSSPSFSFGDESFSPQSRDELVRAVADALAEGRQEDVHALVVPLHYSDGARLFERLNAEQRRLLIDIMRFEFDAEILCDLDPAVREDVVACLGFADLAAAVRELDSDDAVHLVGHLNDDERERVLAALPLEDRTMITQGLSYPEYTAGRLMQRELVAVPAYWTVGQTIDYLRESPNLPEDFYDIYVVDPRHRPAGKVALNRLLRARRPVRLREILDLAVQSIAVTMDQEDVAVLFREHDLVSGPVVDRSGRLVGVITVDDVVDVIDKEAADDMLRLGGVAEPDLYRAVIGTVRSRFTWLLVNLGTAVLVSMVIGMFDGTIKQIVTLAVLMPIVASTGGNAGTQTMTVAVRALATRELTAGNALRVLGKEILVGCLNGVIFSAIIGTVTWIRFGTLEISFIIAAAMVINIVCAALAGLLVPLGFDRIKVDPAVASPVFVTAVTDVIGFFAFLSLATFLLL